jgi:hypothetical protein
MASSSPALDDILAARTHYEVLKVEQPDRNANDDIDTAVLRKAYLRRSVQAHPDKNPPEAQAQATQAFQRVALAWQVLSDDARRRQYNADLRRGGATDMEEDYAADSDSDDNNDDGVPHHPRTTRRSQTYYAGPPPSMQESIFLFTTVVGGLMGSGSRGGTAANLAETLFWADRWMQSQSQSTSRGGGEHGEEPLPQPSAQENASLAMAVGNGLQVASAAVRSMGLTQTADKMQQGARLAQVAGAATLLADQPAVQRVLQQGAASLHKFKGGISVVRTVLQAQREAAAMAQQQTKGGGV